MPLVINIEKTLNELNITRNKLAVESKIRPATLHEMVHGKTQALKLDTLERILDTLNYLSKKQGTRIVYITDIIEYIPEIELTDEEFDIIDPSEGVGIRNRN